MASVTFYSKDNGAGDQRAFTCTPGDTNSSLYLAVSDLSGYKYDDASKHMDNTINSLQTDENSWLFVFSQSGYTHKVERFGPNTTSDEDLGNMTNTINSFILYGEKPNFWDAPESFPANLCSLNLYPTTNFEGTPTNLVGAGNVLNTSCISQFADLGSLTTGPQAWVQLYSDISLETQIAQFGPNSIIPNFLAYGSDPVISIAVYDEAPDSWSGNSATLPNLVLTLQDYQTSAQIESFITGIIGAVPLPGEGIINDIASGLVQLFWPSGPDDEAIWNDMSNYMTTLVGNLIAENDLAYLNDRLEGYAQTIKAYNGLNPSSQKVTELQTILTDLSEDQVCFCDPNNPEQTLPYLVAFGTISVAMLAEYAYNYSTISAGQTDPNAEQHTSDLTATINFLTTATTEAQANALQWRIAQITKGDLTLSDAFCNYEVSFPTNADRDSYYDFYSDQIQTEYTNQLNGALSPVILWQYLLPSNTSTGKGNENSAFPTTVFTALPTLETALAQMSTGPVSGSQTYYSPLQSIDLTGKTITGINIINYNGNICGLELILDGSKVTLGMGVPENLTGYYYTFGTTSISLDADEYIVSIFGGTNPLASTSYSSPLTFAKGLFFRTNKGRDCGYASGSYFFYTATPPQGVNPVLVSLSGVLFSSDPSGLLALVQINFGYEYNVFSPLPSV